jgi:hypothetical protein
VEERILGKDEVTGSIPVVGSKNQTIKNEYHILFIQGGK